MTRNVAHEQHRSPEPMPIGLIIGGDADADADGDNGRRRVDALLWVHRVSRLPR
jgi:hypothetical protein